MIGLIAVSAIGFALAFVLYVATDLASSSQITTMFGIAPRVAYWKRVSHRFGVVMAVMLVLFLTAEVLR